MHVGRMHADPFLLGFVLTCRDEREVFFWCEVVKSAGRAGRRVSPTNRLDFHRGFSSMVIETRRLWHRHGFPSSCRGIRSRQEKAQERRSMFG